MKLSDSIQNHLRSFDLWNGQGKNQGIFLGTGKSREVLRYFNRNRVISAKFL